MATLNEKQIRQEYFGEIGGFLGSKIIHELREYKGEEQLCIACTQLSGEEEKVIFPDIKTYSESEKKKILKEWIDFFNTETKMLKKLHFNSKVPQPLFDAACCQKNLKELRFKWGSYSELSSLENLENLEYLYIGQGTSVKDITVLGKLKSLIVLHIEGFKQIEDYSSLTSLESLEQLVISRPILAYTPIKDLEFLRAMPNLRSISIKNVVIRKEYTSETLEALSSDLPNLYAINNCILDFKKVLA